MKIGICEFLSAFFPDEREQLRFRIFAPKGYPKGKNDPQSKPFGDIYSKEYTVTLAALASDYKLQEQVKNENQLCGMYFIVNSGISDAKQLPLGVYARKSRKDEKPEWTQYTEDSDIRRFNAFFAESDDKSIEHQLAELECCPLSPSIVVITRKSAHAYWLCAPGVLLAEWIEIQTRLIAYFGSDASIKNPSRVMRLPNLYHLSYDMISQTIERKRVEITRFEPERRFTVEQMRAAFPAVERQEGYKWPASTANPGQYPDWESLGNEARRRMSLHPTAHKQGEKIVLRGICHNGKGNSALFFNTITGKYHCDNEGCRKEDILRALGLPERPTDKPEFKLVGKIISRQAVALSAPGHSPSNVVSDFLSRFSPVSSSVTGDTPISVDEWIVDDEPLERPLGVCPDCRAEAIMFGKYCFECSELRKFLSDGPSALTCGCTGANRWRFRNGGFKWYCGNCKRAPRDAVWSFQNGGKL